MNTAAAHRLACPSAVGADRRAEGDKQTSSVDASIAWRAMAPWPLWTVLTLFWTYVALSNVLYAHSMSLSLDPRDVEHYFASWQARVLQHIFLYPVLVGAIWASLRCGWKPAWRAVPLQLILAIGFSALAAPFMYIATTLVDSNVLGPYFGAASAHAGVLIHLIRLGGQDRPYMIASTTSFFLAYGCALALGTGLALYQRYRDSELRVATLEHAWSGARLTALRMQLSPHTLFNLLHTIRGQIGRDPASAQSMVVQLADLLRRLLTFGERDFCRLTEEMHFVSLYLGLQQRRFADRLQLTLPDAAQMPSVWVPSLILQPLVENAVIHGLPGHTGTVVIRIDVAVSEDSLVIRVSNTIAEDQVWHHDGIGLRNVRDRLAAHFGTRASLQAGRDSPHEWLALVRIPMLGEARQT